MTSFAAFRKEAGLFCGSFRRKGEAKSLGLRKGEAKSLGLRKGEAKSLGLSIQGIEFGAQVSGRGVQGVGVKGWGLGFGFTGEGLVFWDCGCGVENPVTWFAQYSVWSLRFTA